MGTNIIAARVEADRVMGVIAKAIAFNRQQQTGSSTGNRISFLLSMFIVRLRPIEPRED
jgi:hypothetical protein